MKIFFISLLIITFLLYLIFSFVLLSIDFRTWNEITRASLVTIIAIFTVIFNVGYLIYQDFKKF